MFSLAFALHCANAETGRTYEKGSPKHSRVWGFPFSRSPQRQNLRMGTITINEKGVFSMDVQQTADWINVLGDFCGMRDVPALTRENLKKRYGWEQADVMVLFGGSILCGAEILAGAMREKAAKRFLIVGGEGHTTESLRQKIHAEFPQIETVGRSEAECFAAYLWEKWGLRPDALETQSTNCGNNVTYCLRLLEEQGIRPASILLSQDASMQRRMDAGFRQACSSETILVNYAVYRAKVVKKEGSLVFAEEISGMWDLERYLSLLLGEIPRLTDDSNGYGPRGKGFIAHVDIPQEVREAYEGLCTQYGRLIRPANEAYSSENAEKRIHPAL